ncbi:MAG: flavodoxin [Oscillospiraceae bacterium]|jgi:flavodoxin short chain|nr:flavodoxin [Oscillospiraceae bacterium]
MSEAAIIYWSGTGNTKAMADYIAKGFKESSKDVDIFEVSGAPRDLSPYVKLAFGCPSMGAEELEDSEFAPYFTGVEGDLSGKRVALFGSYGWGDGEWMRSWEARVRDRGAILAEDGLTQQETPEESACVEYGKRFAVL